MSPVIAYWPTPFPHCAIRPFLDPSLSSDLLRWLQNHSNWTRIKRRYYQYDEINFIDYQHIGCVSAALCPAILSETRAILEDTFSRRLNRRICVRSHRLQAGDGIGLHSDEGCGEAALVLNLNDGWFPDNGGLFVVHNGPTVEAIERLFIPYNNTLVAFALGQFSYHSVTDVRRGIRFSVTFFFYPP